MSTEYQRLIEGLVHWDEDVRKLCAERLEAYEFPVADLLITALSDSNISIRCIAAESLGTRRDACAKEALISALCERCNIAYILLPYCARHSLNTVRLTN